MQNVVHLKKRIKCLKGDTICQKALITRYTQQGHDRGALNCFKQVENEGLSNKSMIKFRAETS